jgi:hypothetical protein
VISRYSIIRPKQLTANAVRSVLQLDQSGTFLHLIAAFSILAYILVYANLPLYLFPAAGHDDGLFISHGFYIASGEWLGPYNQLTLMKGPGYPLFLAVMSLFRIPITLAHAVVWASSIWLLSYATKKIFKSVFLSITVLEVLLWNFGPHSMRVLRDEISTPQLLTTFAFLLLALFSAKKSVMLVCASLSGLVFGWFWITREEGMLAIPAIVILLGCYFHKTYSSGRSLRSPIKMLAVFLGSWAAVLTIVAFINFRVYRTFCIVDVKGEFEGALEALESVKPDTYIPFTLISTSSREKVYRVSPTFAQLRPLLEGPGGPIELWGKGGCRIYPATCGDYVAGLFIWALRDAVATHGDYSSARAASNFYRKVHNEIKKACRSGTISCYHNPLPFMPHINKDQWLRAGFSFKAALIVLSFQNPPLQNDANSIGADDQIRAAAAFLNVPNHTPPPPILDSMINHRIINFAARKRRSAIRIYAKFMPALLVVGFVLTAILAVQCILNRSYSIGFAILCAAWISVACRLAALILIDISSFPGITHLYIGYAYLFACYASVVSIFLVVREFSHKKQSSDQKLNPASRIALGSANPTLKI